MKLNLNELKYIINESSKRLLMEISNNAIETMLKAANPDLAPYFNKSMGEICMLTNPEDGSFNMLRGWLCPQIGVNPDEGVECGKMKLKDWLRLNILRQFHINRGNGPLRYLKGIVRICCSDDIKLYDNICLNDSNQEHFKIFKQIIAFMHSHNIDMDEDLNGLGFTQLRNKIYPLIRQEMIKKFADKQGKDVAYQTGDYTVKEIPSFKEASKYGWYTTWCVTQEVGHFEHYTSDGSQFFFCLKNGFENVPDRRGENCPLDEYGLSMVSVCISPSGEPKFITTRWNHENGGENNPKLHTMEQIEEVLGISKEIFLENINPKIVIDDIKYTLENTNLSLDKIFRVVLPVSLDLTVVGLHDEDKRGCMVYNVIKDRELLSDTWYVDFRVLDDKSIQVRNLDGKYNIFNKTGKVFKEDVLGYVDIYDKRYGLYKVEFKQYGDSGTNLININGEKCLPENVSYISPMHSEYAVVRNKNGLSNFINSQGKLVWDKWRHINLYNYRNNGINWNEGIAVIKMPDDTCNYLDIETGKILMDESQYRCDSFVLGYGKVTNAFGQRNLVDKGGKFLFDKWVNDVNPLKGEYFSVSIKDNEGWTICDKNGDILTNKSWKLICFFDGKYGAVSDDMKNYKLINSNFETVLETPYIIAFRMNNDTFLVAKFTPTISYNVMTLDGKLLLPDENLAMDFKTSPGIIGFKDSKDNTLKYEINTITGEITEW